MKEVTMKVYHFDELTQDAQQHVLEKRYENSYWPFTDDTNDVLSTFEQIFDISVDIVGGYNAYDNSFIVRTNFEYDEEDLTGVRLLKYLQNNYMQYLTKPLVRYSKNYCNNGYKKYYSKVFSVVGECPLTGYFLDCDIIDPIIKFVKQPTNNITLHDLLCKCVANYLKVAQKDFDDYYSKEYAQVDYSERGSLFFEDGSIYDMNPMN